MNKMIITSVHNEGPIMKQTKFTPGLKVNVFKYRKAVRKVSRVIDYGIKKGQEEIIDQHFNERYLDHEGTFEAWGVNYEEFETGAGNFSCAIVSTDEGKVELIEVEQIETTLKAATEIDKPTIAQEITESLARQSDYFRKHMDEPNDFSNEGENND